MLRYKIQEVQFSNNWYSIVPYLPLFHLLLQQEHHKPFDFAQGKENQPFFCEGLDEFYKITSNYKISKLLAGLVKNVKKK